MKFIQAVGEGSASASRTSIPSRISSEMNE